ncbi:MAG TPA: prenyltransferase [Polyangiaceae bacterium]|jgi:1,4-dihydroxy-2-naphthoate octaprenyltransferase|nr:prenyltransferase [Polyangiaceae bacterium]
MPLLYGQALAFAAHGTFRWKLFAAVHLFGLMDQLFVVYTNDVADYASDVHNTTHGRYSGGSRVLVEGKLEQLDLARAATLSLFGMAAVSAYLVFREHRAFMVVIAAIAAHLMWVYSFPPFRLSYRGFGEMLQGIGLGVLLPIAGFYAQAGTLTGLSPLTLLPGFLLGYAGHVVAALADAPSDAASNKRTLAVRRGEPAARRTVLVVLGMAALATPLAVPGASAVTWILATAAAGATVWRSLRLADHADSVDRGRCERFTGAALAAIAVVILLWAAVLVADRLAA